jgi:hypothetical protein
MEGQAVAMRHMAEEANPSLSTSEEEKMQF